MTRRLILTIIIAILPVFIFAALDERIRLTSIGFLPDKEKKATIAATCSSFTVKRKSDNTTAFSGTATGPYTQADTSETNLYIADFSSLTEEGTFYLDVPGVGQSHDFSIAKDVFNNPYYVVMRGFYLWRCGTAVDAWYNGNHYTHAACHMNDAYQDYVGGGHTLKDGKGGWHDAGDYNKYIVNAGISVGMLFMAWEHFGNTLNSISLDIPNTAPGYPDFLKEIKWEIDWVLKMAYPDSSGRVSHKLSAYNFDTFEMPENETADRFFTRYGTAATADYVAMLAMAARIFAPYDSTYANQCLNAAWTSYNWLRANTANYDPSGDITNDGFSTGGYGTSDPDDRLWAAAEMWETTGSSIALSDFETRANNYADKTDADWDWGNVKNLGMFTYLLSTRTGKNTAIVDDIKNDLLADANAIVNTRNNNRYGRPLGNSYYWGCNGSVARQTMILQIANMISPNQNYVNTALDAIHHLFGRNYYCRSYVTGLGYKPPMHPHDRRSGADGIVDPWPGYLVGGGHTATGWVDQQDNYETNEIAINWQGALVYALAGFVLPPGTPTPTNTWNPLTPTYTFTPTLSPTPTPPTVFAECASSIVIDGNLNDATWQEGTWQSVTRVVVGTPPSPISAQFKVRWDANALYVGVDVTDSALYNDSGTQWYNDDSVEVYLDMNNNHSTTYQADDFQFSLRYNDATLREQNNKLSTSTAAYASKTGGWTAEFRLTWSDLGVTPAANARYGFDVGVNYDQNGGNREGVLMWNGTNNNWQDTSAFGDVVLNSCGTPTNTPSLTSTNTRTNTPTNTNTITNTRTNTPTNTDTITNTITDTPTNTNTPTGTTTFTNTFTNTQTVTGTQPATWTNTNTPTNTISFTATHTQTNTYSFTATHTNTNSATNTPSFTSTFTLTQSFTSTQTVTGTQPATWTNTNTPTNTVSFTSTHSATNTATVTGTQSFTATQSYTQTQINTPTNTQTPVLQPSATPFEQELDIYQIKDIKIYPHPYSLNNNSDLFISFNTSKNFKEFKFTIFTIAFRKVKEFVITGNYKAGDKVIQLNRTNFNDFSKGLYYYIIILETSDGGKIKSKIDKFIFLK